MLDRPLRHERQALGERRPVLFGVACHQVEGHAHRLHRAAEHPQIAQALARVVLHQRQLEPFPHDLGGDAVGVGLDR